MTICGQCSTALFQGQKYCSNCGTPTGPANAADTLVAGALSTQIKAVLSDEYKDAKILELEAAEAIVSRISSWAKLFGFFAGIPVVLLTAGLGIFGFKNLHDVRKIDAASDQIKTAQRKLLEDMNDLEQKTAKLRTKLETLSGMELQLRTLTDRVDLLQRLLTDEQQKKIRAFISLVETGSPTLNFGSLLVLDPSSGPTFGITWATRGSGQLRALIDSYVMSPGALYAKDFEIYGARLTAKDPRLDTDAGFLDLLKKAATDPAMQVAQLRKFDQLFFRPSLFEANRVGISSALGITVVLDSMIQGGWAKHRDETRAELKGLPSDGIPEHTWVMAYLKRRIQYLESKHILDSRRAKALLAAAEQGNWSLQTELPGLGQKRGK